MEQPRHAVLRFKQAAALRTEVRAAHETVQQAEDEYQNAFAIASGTDLSADGLLAFLQRSRVYTTAVLTYSNAVMTQLLY